MYFGVDGLSISNKFEVDKNGNLIATGADISGIITATSGNIGGFDIVNGKLITGSYSIDSKGYYHMNNGSALLSSSDIPAQIGDLYRTNDVRFSVGSFFIDSSGNAYCLNTI